MIIISIHALLAESDAILDNIPQSHIIFLSTLSLRRATAAYGYIWPAYLHFYPRSPCGERPEMTLGAIILLSISIHALLAESDLQHKQLMRMSQAFLSTLSLRRATPRAWPASSPRRYFYPRSPCGERQAPQDRAMGCRQISIHALLAESDWQAAEALDRLCHFYPRSPCGERL